MCGPDNLAADSWPILSGLLTHRNLVGCERLHALGIAQVALHGTAADAQGRGNLAIGQALGPKLAGPVGLGFGRAGLAADVDAPFLRGLDAGGLTLLAGLLLHFGHAQQHGG